MGLAGILIVCASGLMLKKNGLSHAATPMHRHDQKKLMTAMLLQDQGHLPSPGMIPKKTTENKTPGILLEDSKEPPLLHKDEIKPVQFQPMNEEPTLPLFPPAPTLTPALIPPIEDTKKPVVEDKKAAPATLPIQIQDEGKTPAPAPTPVAAAEAPSLEVQAELFQGGKLQGFDLVRVLAQ